jgi:AraC family transcriptional regulator
MDEIVKRAVERAIETMQENLGERLTIDDMARSALFSKFHFSRVFQRVTGVSPGRFLSAMRLEEAKRLLVSTSFTVSDISHRVGYNSVGTFSARFRSSVGVSPSTYRALGGVTSQGADSSDGLVGHTWSTVRGQIIAPPTDQVGLVFVGLFPTWIPEGPPVRHAVLKRSGPYTMQHVPVGTWYLIAHSVAPGTEETVEATTFVGAHGPLTIRPDTDPKTADVHLRPMRTLDPPVLTTLREVRTAVLSAAAS